MVKYEFKYPAIYSENEDFILVYKDTRYLSVAKIPRDKIINHDDSNHIIQIDKAFFDSLEWIPKRIYDEQYLIEMEKGKFIDETDLNTILGGIWYQLIKLNGMLSEIEGDLEGIHIDFLDIFEKIYNKWNVIRN